MSVNVNSFEFGFAPVTQRDVNVPLIHNLHFDCCWKTLPDCSPYNIHASEIFSVSPT